MTEKSLPLRIATLDIESPLILAPMAGITHSAFRRLCSRFGGYGALFTEMLPVTALCVERLAQSPFTKRRKQEGKVVYQLLVTADAPVEIALGRLAELEPSAIDINLGCPAPIIQRKGGGCSLFDDIARLEQTLTKIRSVWRGPLSVKCRLGHEGEGWRDEFVERLTVFRNAGIDALCVHPRFFHEKLKRRARWELFGWIKSLWRGPLIGNGDMTDPTALELLRDGSCDALMIGRAAVERPWIFQVLCGNTVPINLWEVWEEFFEYTLEDFPPERAIGRVKEFTRYYAENFFFGHELFRRVQSATCLDTLHRRAEDFFGSNPQVSAR